MSGLFKYGTENCELLNGYRKTHKNKKSTKTFEYEDASISLRL